MPAATHVSNPITSTQPSVIIAAPVSAVDAKATQVHTELEHVSIIEMPEDVDTLTCGSESVQVQTQHNKILILPLQKDVQTNLIVWTKHMKMIFEIMAAGDPRGQTYITVPLPPGIGGPSKEEIQKNTDLLLGAALNHFRFIDSSAIKMDGKKIDVLIRQLTEDSESYYVKIALRNGPNHSYYVTNPSVEYLEPTFASGTPQAYLGKMIPDSVLHEFGFYTSTELKTHGSTLSPTNLAPRQFTQWVIAFNKPRKTPGIYRFTFPSDDGSPVYATVVF